MNAITSSIRQCASTVRRCAARRRELRRKAESGFTITIQAMYYVTMLFIFFALIFDFGSAGYTLSMASNAVRLAAHDAVKNIDQETFINTQEIRLKDDATTRAQDFVNDMTHGLVTVNDVSVSRLAERDVIVVRAVVVARLPIFNSLIGMGDLSLPVDAYAEPAYGIDEEGQ